MMNRVTGNIVTEGSCFYGCLMFENGTIASIERKGGFFPGGDWVLPGFIDVHTHAFGPCEEGVQIREMSLFGPRIGLTGFCPTMSADCHEKLMDFLRTTREVVEQPSPEGARVLGAHLEGPFLDGGHCGGMPPEWLREANVAEAEEFLQAAHGALRLLTLAPELPNAPQVVERLRRSGVVVSAGHTGCSKEQLDACIEAGLSQMCHLFDTYDGRCVQHGVSMPCLADCVLIDDRLSLEFIGDGIHVPGPLVQLARRAAGYRRLIAITDSLQGTGMPDGRYIMPDGRAFTMRAGDVGRLEEEPGVIVGSCLTMPRAFYNMISRFGFAPWEAAACAATNPARALGEDGHTGSLCVGKDADIVVLSADDCAVLQTIQRGRVTYSAAAM